MATEKYVNLKIRAQDQFSTVLNKGQTALSKFMDTASRKDVILASQAQKASMADLRNEIERLQASYKQYNQQAASGNATRQMGADMVATRAKILSSKAALAEMQGTLNTLKGASKSSFAEFSRGADAARAAYNSAEQQIARIKTRLTEVKAAQDAAAASARTYFGNQPAANRTGSNFGAANARIAQESADAVRRYKTEAASLNTELRRLTPSVKGSFLAFSQKATKLGEASAAMRENQTAANVDDVALKKLSRSTVKLGQDQKSTAAAVDRATRSLREQSAVPPARGVGGGPVAGGGKMFGGATADVEMYGLRPYQMVNLGYQVNDVVSGLAMGQAPMQVLAQQVGQFVQIWPQMMVGLVRGLPILAGLGAAFAPIIVNLAAINREAQSTQQFTAQLALMADQGTYTAAELAKSVEAVRDLGMATDDARALVKSFVDEGIRPERIDEFAQAASDLAGIIGVDVADAAATLTGAFTGGFEGLREVDQELNIFTASQLEAIRTMYETGDAAGAQEFAFDALQEKMAAGAAEAGTWTKATQSLGGAWGSLIDLFADSLVMKFATGTLDALGKAIERVGEGISFTLDKANQMLGGDDNGLSDLQLQFRDTTAEMEKLADRAEFIQGRIDMGIVPQRGGQLAGAQATLAAIAERMEEIKALRLEIRDQIAAGPGAVEPGLTVEQIEALRKSYGDYSAEIRRANEERAFETQMVGQTAQQVAIETAQREALVVAMEAGLDKLEDWPALWAAESAAIEDSIRTKGDAEAAQESLDDAIASTEKLISGVRSEYQTATQAVSDHEAEIAILEAEYGRLDPRVIAAKNALAAFKNEAFAAIGEARALAYAASELGRAMASLGTFEANMGTRLAAAQRTISMVEQGLSEARIEAENEYNRQNAERNRILIEEGRYTVDQIAELAENQISALEQVKLAEEAASEAMRAQFNPPKPKTAGGGAGASTDSVKEERQRLEKLMDDFMAYRTALLDQIEQYRDTDQDELADALVPKLEAVNASTLEAIANLKEFLGTLSGPEIEAALLNLESISDEIENLAEEALTSKEEIDGMLTDGLVDSSQSFFEKIANGENAIKSLSDTFRQFASDFLIEIAKMIGQQIILNALQAASGGGGGGSIAGLVNAIVRHDGGMAGVPGRSRMVDPAIFANATRYHGGGGPNLKANEVPAILEDDEEVLTREDPRHQLNGGLGGGSSPQVNIKQVNVLDSAQLIEQALSTSEGERVLINFMTKNRGKVRGAIGS